MEVDNYTKPKAQSKSQLAAAYNVGLDTFNSWIKPHLKDIGNYIGKVYSPKQVGIIYDRLGEP